MADKFFFFCRTSFGPVPDFLQYMFLVFLLLIFWSEDVNSWLSASLFSTRCTMSCIWQKTKTSNECLEMISRKDTLEGVCVDMLTAGRQSSVAGHLQPTVQTRYDTMRYIICTGKLTGKLPV